MNITDDYTEEQSYYTSLREEQRGLPVLIRKDFTGISLKDSLVLSGILHHLVGAVFFFIAKLIFVLMLIFGLTMPFIPKKEHKMNDIEFVFTRNDIKKIQAAKKKISSKNTIKTPASSKPDKTPFMPDNDGLKSNKKTKILTPVVNRNPARLTQKAHSETTIPLPKTPHKGNRLIKKEVPDVFSMPMTKIKSLSGETGFGADGKPGVSAEGLSHSSIISSGPGAGGTGEGSSPGRGKRRGGGYSYGDGTAGAPGVGKSMGNNGNILRDPDLNPYISDLQRRIQRNWKPPKGNENKKVSLFLRIAKDGRLVILNIKNTSLNPEVDNAATNAVKKTQPLKSLPEGFHENYLDVIFNFDYNVSGIRK